MALIENSTLMWFGWIVAFSVVSSAATWLIRSWLVSGKSLKDDLREMIRDLRADVREVNRGLSALSNGLSDVRERVAKIESVIETFQWDDQGDLGSDASPPRNRRTPA